ncbi:hypothetical protein QOZ80_2BG0182310 [Eleusine coracana subsp. coracana]|nr:hypothetical protein QOZ80_2BG0182310 [Eleusine coracana subsp. coracana]
MMASTAASVFPDDLLREIFLRLPAGSAKEIRSWDGILCVEFDKCIGPYDSCPYWYVLLNPVSRACTIVSAPDPCREEGPSRVVSTRGYIAGAYSHPVTGAFHLLHCSLYHIIGADEDVLLPCFQLLRVDGSPASTWREIPASTDICTTTLESVISRSRCASTATVHGILHWRPTHREQKELLVYDTQKEEFGSMPLPKLGNGEDALAVSQRSISTLAGKLCLLAEVEASNTTEVWVLEDYQSQDWRLRQRIQIPFTPIFVIYGMDELRSVEPIGGVSGQVEKMIFHGTLEAVYHVRSSQWWWLNVWATLHRESLLPHELSFGAAPRARGFDFSQ